MQFKKGIGCKACYDENYNILAPWLSAKWIVGKTDILNKNQERLVEL